MFALNSSDFFFLLVKKTKNKKKHCSNSEESQHLHVLGAAFSVPTNIELAVSEAACSVLWFIAGEPPSPDA